MKYLLLFVISFSAYADIELADAYKREKSYLSQQKESLLNLKKSLSSSADKRKLKAQKEIEMQQDEFAKLQMINQQLQEEFKALEKVAKEGHQISGQLDKTSLKINESITDIKAKLGLAHSTPLEIDPVKKFQSQLASAYDLLSMIESEEWRPHAFLDEKNHLVQGEVLFNGLFSAWGKFNGKLYSLIPYNHEFLKTSPTTSKGEAYLFAPNFEISGFKAAKTWKESIADLIPGFIMSIIMLVVLGLFFLLVKE